MTSILKVNQIQNTSGTTALTVDSAGIVTKSAVPAFHAYGINNGQYATLGTTVPFNATALNSGNHFNTSTYTFTAPVSGIYCFTCMALLGTVSTYLSLYKNNGSDINYLQLHGSSSSGWAEATGTALVELNATNTVRMYLTSGSVYLGGTNSTDSLNSFTGYLIG